ncbi:hypothetical protein [Cognatiluteimonas profundi]|uniref:hypothetical protein n=1 Tax=Cognatiluteimonas profundi TaxID=2594501 RepID=UPI00131CDB4E|nr:hypothetical protein [Lysobacter profundi]
MSGSTRHIASALAIVVLLAIAGCAKTDDRADAQDVAAGISSTMQASTAGSNKACKLLTRAEISEALGKPVDEGHDWSAGGCEWRSGGDAVQVQQVAADDWEPLAKSSGGESLPGIGLEAFVGPWLGSARAGAKTSSGCVYVMTPTRDLSVKLLRQATSRMGAQ